MRRVFIEANLYSMHLSRRMQEDDKGLYSLLFTEVNLYGRMKEVENGPCKQRLIFMIFNDGE